MIQEGTIDMTQAEQDALAAIADVQGLTRSEPNEQGSLLVTAAHGVFEIDPDGSSRQLS